MPTANRLELAGLKGLVLQRMKDAERRGLYTVRKQQRPASVTKMPPGLARIKKEHELNASTKPKIFNINFVFERTIPALAEKGVFAAMTRSEADKLVKELVDFASRSVARAKERQVYGEDIGSYYRSIEDFFTVELVRYSGWIAREKGIEEIVRFRAGIRSANEQFRIAAIRRAGVLGMVEATDDLLHILRTGSKKEKLEVIQVMQKLGKKDILIDQFDATYKVKVNDLTSQVPKELAGRSGHKMVTGQDGNIYMFGGYNYDKKTNSKYFSDFWSYDPRAGKWTDLSSQVPAKLQARGDHRMIVGQDGKIYIFGGDRGDSMLRDFWSYDPKAGKWTNISSQVPTKLRARRFYEMIVGQNGNFYLFGGMDPSSGSARFLRDFWSYDPKAGNWTDLSSQVPAKLFARAGFHMAAGQDGNIYILGGEYSSRNPYNDSHFWSYDPRMEMWTDLTSQVPATFLYSLLDSLERRMSLYGSNIYLFSGVEDDIKQLWSYDTKAGEWTDISAHLPAEVIVRAGSDMVVGRDGNIYLFGGLGNPKYKKGNKLEVSKEFRQIVISKDTDIIEKEKKKLREGK